jgi:hypothetical protein
LNRCRYQGDDGMKIWVGLGVICDNLITLGHSLENSPALGSKQKGQQARRSTDAPRSKSLRGCFCVLILPSPHSAETRLRKKRIFRRKVASSGGHATISVCPPLHKVFRPCDAWAQQAKR